MIGSFLLFAWLGLKIKYEEDISKLLPSNTIGDTEQLVFDNLKVKDKIFVEVFSKEACDASAANPSDQDKEILEELKAVWPYLKL
mgnify:CR=1 FL=1